MNPSTSPLADLRMLASDCCSLGEFSSARTPSRARIAQWWLRPATWRRIACPGALAAYPPGWSQLQPFRHATSLGKPTRNPSYLPCPSPCSPRRPDLHVLAQHRRAGPGSRGAGTSPASYRITDRCRVSDLGRHLPGQPSVGAWKRCPSKAMGFPCSREAHCV